MIRQFGLPNTHEYITVTKPSQQPLPKYKGLNADTINPAPILTLTLATSLTPVPEHQFVEDRAFNDLRYPVSVDKLTALGWRGPRVDWHEGLCHTVRWYKENQVGHADMDAQPQRY